MIQPIAIITPPKATISRGPRCAPIRSTIQPSSGVSQVSSATNRLKAIWMSATAQPCARFIGWTNRVQPYCRLAIITIATMPMTSCSQRFVCGRAGAPAAGDALCMVLFSTVGTANPPSLRGAARRRDNLAVVEPRHRDCFPERPASAGRPGVAMTKPEPGSCCQRLAGRGRFRHAGATQRKRRERR